MKEISGYKVGMVVESISTDRNAPYSHFLYLKGKEGDNFVYNQFSFSCVGFSAYARPDQHPGRITASTLLDNNYEVSKLTPEKFLMLFHLFSND